MGDNKNDFAAVFLAEFDRRISAEDKQTPEASKERLRKMRPAIMLLLKNAPVESELFIRRWLAVNCPEAFSPSPPAPLPSDPPPSDFGAMGGRG